MTLLIVDGADATGKTTLAHAIVEQGDLRYEHRGPPESDPFDEYETSLLGFRPREDAVIFDRYHVGELVWPKIFGRKTSYTPEQHLHVELFLRSRGAVLVACHGKWTTVRDRLRTRGDEVLVGAKGERQLERALASFDQQLRASRLLKTWHSIEDPVLISTLLAQARSRARASAAALDITSELIGELERPSVLLVGDRRKDGSAGMPFCPNHGLNSSLFLMRSLLESGLALSRIAIVNSRVSDSRGVRHLADLREQLGRPKVVALGSRASASLESLGIPHGRTHHPQYIRRFFYNQDALYARSLSAASLAAGDTRDWFPVPTKTKGVVR